MPSLPRSPTPDAERRSLPNLDERLWPHLRFVTWRRGTERFLGRHGGRYRGFAVQAEDSRPYVPGDDCRFLDQRVLARTDRDYVKQARLEASLRCLFILDATPSMAFGPAGRDKLSEACGIAWLGAALFSSLGDAFGLAVCGAPAALPFGRGPAHLAALGHILRTVRTDGGAALVDDLRAASGLLARRAVGIVLSDFIAPGRALMEALSSMTETGADLVLIQVLSPPERELPYRGETRFVDPETGTSTTVDPDAIRGAYRRLVAERRARIDRFARARGATFFSVEAGRTDGTALWTRIFHGR